MRAVRRTLIAILCMPGVLVALSSVPVRSQTSSSSVSQELELLKEEETVSIAVRHEQPISQAPSNVYVITDEDIRQSGATDLPTVLRRIPGLEIVQMSGADFNVSVRGDNQLSANKLLVMVDGRSIYNDGQGFVVWKNLPITLPEIKRIEVLKGPASVVYGFNAFDGVINIVTKSPGELKGTTIQFGGGELGTISSAAIQAGTAGKLGYRLSVGHDQNNEWRNHDALAFRASKFNVHTEYALTGDSKVSVSGGLVDANRFDGLFIESSLGRSTPSQGYANIVYERPNFFIRTFWMESTMDQQILPHPLLDNLYIGTDRNGNPNAAFTTNTYNIEAQHTVEIGPTYRLTSGVNYRHNTLSSNFIDNFASENRLGLYIQNEWQPVRQLSVVAGVRYDLDTFIHPTFSPRAAILLTPLPNHTFRASVSVGYRPPTLLETHADMRFPSPFNPPGTPTLQLLGNRNMIPEQLISYEVGYQGWFMKHRLRVRADLFANLIRDLQDARFDNNTRINMFDNRRGKASIYGGEAGLDFLLTSWLSGFANFSYVKVDDEFGGNVARAAPPYKANVGIRGDWANGLSGDAAFHYVDSVSYPVDSDFNNAPLFGNPIPNPRVGSYYLLNLRAGYRFWQQKAAAGYLRDAEIAVSVFNALDDQHKEHPLGDIISRRIMGWLTVRF